jgi:hypothetical protein
MTNKTNRQSLRSAIDGNCKNCIYDCEEPGTWRQQVENCAITSCALYRVRPLPIGKKRPIDIVEVSTA